VPPVVGYVPQQVRFDPGVLRYFAWQCCCILANGHILTLSYFRYKDYERAGISCIAVSQAYRRKAKRHIIFTLPSFAIVAAPFSADGLC